MNSNFSANGGATAVSSAPIQDQEALNAFHTPQSTPDVDKRRRFGYNPCFSNLTMKPSGSGLNAPVIPNGVPLLFTTKTLFHRGGYNALRKEYPRIATEYPASHFRSAVNLAFRSKEDFGYRNLDMLTNVPYEASEVNGEMIYRDDAFLYWKAVHPAITCSFGLEAKVQHEFGDATYQACPTCRLAHLNKLNVMEIEGLDVNILIALKAVLIEANTVALQKLNLKIGEVEREMVLARAGRTGRAGYLEFDYLMLKMLHRKPKEETDTAAESANVMAQALKDALGKSDSPDLTEMKAMLARQQELINSLLAQKGVEATTEPTTEVALEPTVEQTVESDISIGDNVKWTNKDGETGTSVLKSITPNKWYELEDGQTLRRSQLEKTNGTDNA